MMSLPLVDPEPWLRILAERFGIPAESFDPYVVYRRNPHTVWITARDLRLPSRPEAATVGMPFFHTRSEEPRPASAAARKFGYLAQRNVVDLNDEQVDALIAGREVALSRRQEEATTGPGWVLARYRGVVLTVAHYRGVLRGAVPKSWSVVSR